MDGASQKLGVTSTVGCVVRTTCEGPRSGESFSPLLRGAGAMGLPFTLRGLNEHVDRWFRDHVVVWWVVLAVIPGIVFAGGELVLGGASLHAALILGAVFGIVFATVTVSFQRWRGA